MFGALSRIARRCASNKTGVAMEANILSNPKNANNIVSHIRPGGFVVGGFQVSGPVVLFDGIFLQWKVPSLEQLSPENLCLFRLLNPKPEILVIGTGDVFTRLPPNILSFFKSEGIRVEIQSTSKASATYNFFVEEGRVAAAALFPLKKL